MGFLDSLFTPRAIDASQFPISGDDFTSVTHTGVNVTADNATKLSAARASVNLITGAIRVLPVDAQRNKGADRVPVARPPQWLEYPTRLLTWSTFIGLVCHSLLIHGNAYIGIVSRDRLGLPEELAFIHPDDVEVSMENRRKIIRVMGKPRSEYTVFDRSGDVLHIMGPTSDGVRGIGPIEEHAQTFGLGFAQEEHAARLFSNGAVTSGVVELPSGATPDPESLKSIGKQFSRNYSGLKNAHKPIVLANGATFRPISLPNDQAQFLESRKFTVSEIARIFGVPPHMIGDVERSTSWGSGIEQQGIGFVTFTLNPWLKQLEDGFSLLLPRGQYTKFNVNGLLRGDVATRAQYYQTLGTMGVMEINEIRALEDMQPLPDGNQPPRAPNESIS